MSTTKTEECLIWVNISFINVNFIEYDILKKWHVLKWERIVFSTMVLGQPDEE